jgi:hypothetical protein
VSGSRFFISSHFSPICSAEADDPNAKAGFNKTKNVNTAAEKSDGYMTDFAVITPAIDRAQRRWEIEFDRTIER